MPGNGSLTTFPILAHCWGPLLQLPLIRANPIPPLSVPDTSPASRPCAKGSPSSPGCPLPLLPPNLLEASILPCPSFHTTSLPQAHRDLALVHCHLKQTKKTQQKPKPYKSLLMKYYCQHVRHTSCWDVAFQSHWSTVMLQYSYIQSLTIQLYRLLILHTAWRSYF